MPRPGGVAMPNCPQCNKPLRELVRRCPSCQADLDLLVDYVKGLRGSLDRAAELTRAGELGQAVWAYLEVLEVDPDNAAARKQVGQVATAVRQFDSTAPGRRWLSQGRVGGKSQGVARWQIYLGVGLLLLAAFIVGFVIGGTGNSSNGGGNADEAQPIKKQDTLMGK